MENVRNTYIYKCAKCNNGEIVTVHKFDGKLNELSIKKCSNKKCKHQYYMKELIDEKLERI